jgi:YggT family protein
VFLLCAFITVYMVVMAARAVLSWFPVRPGTAMASISMVLYEITEPVLAPVRRIIPPAGMFDLSFIVVFFLLVILRQIVCSV